VFSYPPTLVPATAWLIRNSTSSFSAPRPQPPSTTTGMAAGPPKAPGADRRAACQHASPANPKPIACTTWSNRTTGSNHTSYSTRSPPTGTSPPHMCSSPHAASPHNTPRPNRTRRSARIPRAKSTAMNAA
jgi:hypothetical protein